MRYILLLLLVSCNAQIDKKEIVPQPNLAYDSLSTALDSLKSGLHDLSLVSDFAKEAQSKIDQLEKENKILEEQRSKEISYVVSDNTEYKSDDRDKKIYELTKELNEKKAEIARLKKVLSDNMVKRNVDKVPEIITPEPLKPNDKSLVIELDKRIKGNGDISDQGISIYIMPYNKKSKKLRVYGFCDMPKLNQLEARAAAFYNGLYFFNDLPKGKYLIKVCSYSGNYMVIERNEEVRQTVEMQVAPPIQ